MDLVVRVVRMDADFVEFIYARLIRLREFSGGRL